MLLCDFQVISALRISRTPEPYDLRVSAVDMHFPPAYLTERTFHKLRPRFEVGELPFANEAPETLPPLSCPAISVGGFRTASGAFGRELRSFRASHKAPVLQRMFATTPPPQPMAFAADINRTGEKCNGLMLQLCFKLVSFMRNLNTMQKSDAISQTNCPELRDRTVIFSQFEIRSNDDRGDGY